jgi:hypothetical protein
VIVNHDELTSAIAGVKPLCPFVYKWSGIAFTIEEVRLALVAVVFCDVDPTLHPSYLN